MSSRNETYGPQLNDRAWLKREYIERARSSADIARELGCGKTTRSEMPCAGMVLRSDDGGGFAGRTSAPITWPPCERGD